MVKPAALEFRPAEPVDYPRCAQIYSEAWRSALPKIPRSISITDFEAEVAGEQIELALLAGHIVGYLSVWEEDAFIHHLYVDPDCNGIGVGTALVARLSERLPHQVLSLKCQVTNLAALAFYRNLGFMKTLEVGTDAFGPWVRLDLAPGSLD